jgi:hypothetical protein
VLVVPRRHWHIVPMSKPSPGKIGAQNLCRIEIWRLNVWQWWWRGGRRRLCQIGTLCSKGLSAKGRGLLQVDVDVTVVKRMSLLVSLSLGHNFVVIDLATIAPIGDVLVEVSLPPLLSGRLLLCFSHLIVRSLHW